MQTDRLYRSSANDKGDEHPPIFPLKGECENLRFVESPLAPDAYRLLPDLSARLPINKDATAYYIPAQRRAIETFAEVKNHKDPKAFAAQTYALLKSRALDLLGLARKAGGLKCGFTKAQAALNSDKAQILLNAYDSAEGGAKKLAHKARALDVPCYKTFCVAEMSAAVGRDNVHHITVTTKQFFNAIHNALSLIDNFDHKDENHGG